MFMKVQEGIFFYYTVKITTVGKIILKVLVEGRMSVINVSVTENQGTSYYKG